MGRQLCFDTEKNIYRRFYSSSLTLHNKILEFEFDQLKIYRTRCMYNRKFETSTMRSKKSLFVKTV